MRDDLLGQQLHRAANEIRLHPAKIQPENKVPAIHISLVQLNQLNQLARRAKPQLISLFKALHNVLSMTVSTVMLVNEIALQGIYSCMLGLVSRWGDTRIKDERDFVAISIASCCQVMIPVFFRQFRQCLQTISRQVGQINNMLGSLAS